MSSDPKPISGLRTELGRGCVDVLKGRGGMLVSVAISGQEFRFGLGDWRKINAAVEDMVARLGSQP